MLPVSLKGKFDLKVVYKFGKTIGGKILNYNDILRKVAVLGYDDILRMSCDCENSAFKHDNFGHVITGDLNIIQDLKLRELCSFGTKFRENPVLNVKQIKSNIGKNVDCLIAKLSRKFGVPKSGFKRWKEAFMVNFHGKLLACVGRVVYRGPVLSEVNTKRELEILRDKFVITVVDKAANNFAFTCKKFYFLKLAEELGLNNITPGNETYVYTPLSEAAIVGQLKQDMLGFGINTDSKAEKLALLYQTPKFHKNPPKMRFIAGNINTVTSKLDSILALVLKMCKTHFKNLCDKGEGFNGIRYQFDVQTSMEVKGMFDSVSGDAVSISINDFSTLYTLFDHDHLLGNISWLIHKLSKNSGFQFVRIGHNRAWWVRTNAEGLVYSVADILGMVDFLVRNTYIKALGSIFRQAKGIVMGGRVSGWLSDCSLMVDEFKFIDGKVKAGLTPEAANLKFFRRYRDDCTTINVSNFLQIAGEIYPPSLTLTQENDRVDYADVLDMEVRLEGGNISTRVYCKTDKFPFDVISLPFLQSNLDSRICYRVFYGQVVRFQRLSTFREHFEIRTKFLADILIARGYKRDILQRQFCRAVDKYISEFQKWALPLDISAWFFQIL